MYEEAVAEGIEVSTIEKGVGEVKEGIEKISNLRRKYTLVENSVGEMREISNDIETLVERGLRNIQEEINRAMQED